MAVSRWWSGRWVVSGLACLAIGCSSTSPPAAKLDPYAALDKLQADLAKQFPEATPFKSVGKATPLSRALDIEQSGAVAYLAAWNAFKAWCKASRGDLYDAPWLGPMPVRVNEDLSAIELMYGGSAFGISRNLEVSACVLGGQTFIMTSGSDGRHRRVVAWFTPAEAASYRSAAKTLRAISTRQRREDDERIVREARTQFLADSPLGTQIYCTQILLEGQVPSDLNYRCDQHLIPFRDFNKNGWRVSSQTVVAEPSMVGMRSGRVTLLIEKVR